jgi:hypothetical protein
MDNRSDLRPPDIQPGRGFSGEGNEPPQIPVLLRYDVYEPATRRLLYSFRQMKEIVAANILNQMPAAQWREGGCFEPDRDPNA